MFSINECVQFEEYKYHKYVTKDRFRRFLGLKNIFLFTANSRGLSMIEWWKKRAMKNAKRTITHSHDANRLHTHNFVGFPISFLAEKTFGRTLNPWTFTPFNCSFFRFCLRSFWFSTREFFFHFFFLFKSFAE